MDGGERVEDGEVDAGAPHRDAFTSLYRQHLPAVRAQVRMWVSPDDVDEIVSSTFMTAWQKFDDIAPGSEKAWLLGVARNHCRNRFRARRRADALTDAITRVTPTEFDPMVGRPEPDEFTPLLRALANLSADEQELLALSVWQELAPAEIALVLGLRQGTVRVRLHRARRRLETEYQRLQERSVEP
jgi:RNA polymerase sigma-70 factor (ECF subfamily)